MEPNQNDKSNQPVENKSNQPIAPIVKKEETNSNAPVANPLVQSAPEQEKVSPVEPTAADAKKISDVPGTKDPKEEEVKGKVTGEAAPVEEKTV